MSRRFTLGLSSTSLAIFASAALAISGCGPGTDLFDEWGKCHPAPGYLGETVHCGDYCQPPEVRFTVYGQTTEPCTGYFGPCPVPADIRDVAIDGFTCVSVVLLGSDDGRLIGYCRGPYRTGHAVYDVNVNATGFTPQTIRVTENNTPVPDPAADCCPVCPNQLLWITLYLLHV